MARLTEGDCYAAFYDDHGDVVASFLEGLARVYGLADHLCVLDMGCGTGRLLWPLVSRGWDVVGMEPQPEYLAKAQAAGSGTPVVVLGGGFAELEAVDRFDLVLAVSSPWWYLRDEAERADALARMSRALHPAGVVFLDGPNFEWILEHYRAPEPSEAHYGGVLIKRDPQHDIDLEQRTWTHLDTFTVPETGQELSTVHRLAILSVEEVTAAVGQAGFTDITTYPSWRTPAPGPPAGPRLMVAARRPG